MTMPINDLLWFDSAPASLVFEADDSWSRRPAGGSHPACEGRSHDRSGASLAAEYGALSCDHLEHLSDRGVRAMAGAGVTAVLLPGAFYFLRETRLPPIAALRAAGVPIAVATDHNPGSSPMLSPLLTLNMACTLFRLTPEEALRGMTVNGARALGFSDRGRLAAGLRADFVAWPLDHPNELSYWIGQRPRARVIAGGKELGRAATPRSRSDWKPA